MAILVAFSPNLVHLMQHHVESRHGDLVLEFFVPFALCLTFCYTDLKGFDKILSREPLKPLSS